MIPLFSLLKSKITEYSVIIIIVLISTFLIHNYFVEKTIDRLGSTYTELEKSKQDLNAKILLQQSVIENDQILIKQKQDENAVQDIKISKLLNKVKNLQKPQIIDQIKDPTEIKKTIANWYGDKTVEFTKDNKFLIILPTVTSLVYDADQWKVNGPILTYNNKILAEANTGLQNGLRIKDSLISSLDKAQLDQGTLIISYKSKDNISQKQIKNLQKTLTVQEENTFKKIVYSFLAGAISYYAYEKIGKH